MKNKILIVSGDPNSINSELIFKSWKKLSISVKKKIYLISNLHLVKKQFKKLNYSLKLAEVKNFRENFSYKKLKIINIDLKFKDPFKIPNKNVSKFITSSLTLAHKLALNDDVNGIINCPIDKKLLNNKYLGVTEFFAKKCGVKNNSEVMLIKSNKLSVSPITTHARVIQVSKKVKLSTIINKIKTIEFWFKKHKKRKPKIAILGLNPHNSELRKNSEETKIIIPAIKKLKKLNINIKGPFSSDTLFIENYKNYDVIVGMYHDQVLAPFKALFKFNAINITLGLKYLRVSPDHGVAIDLVGKNKANITSLTHCIDFVNKFKK